MLAQLKNGKCKLEDLQHDLKVVKCNLANWGLSLESKAWDCENSEQQNALEKALSISLRIQDYNA
jgi:hypothetical protein